MVCVRLSQVLPGWLDFLRTCQTIQSDLLTEQFYYIAVWPIGLCGLIGAWFLPVNFYFTVPRGCNANYRGWSICPLVV